MNNFRYYFVKFLLVQFLKHLGTFLNPTLIKKDNNYEEYVTCGWPLLRMSKLNILIQLIRHPEYIRPEYLLNLHGGKYEFWTNLNRHKP